MIKIEYHSLGSLFGIIVWDQIFVWSSIFLVEGRRCCRRLSTVVKIAVL